MDAEILSLLVPATLAVFLDPAMALIDTGVPSITQRCYREGTHKLSGSDFLSAGAGHPGSPPGEILPWLRLTPLRHPPPLALGSPAGTQPGQTLKNSTPPEDTCVL